MKVASSRTRLKARYEPASGAVRCRRRFLRFFPKGFRDATYLDWEREYKWAVHEEWEGILARPIYEALLVDEQFEEIASRALRAEQRARHSMIFSFEKMALRDAVRSQPGARAFATGLYAWLHGAGSEEERFNAWVDVVDALPRRQTRVLTWPIVTVFGFIAMPRRHVFVKPTVTRTAARRYGFDLQYQARPSWAVYHQVLEFGATIRRDVADLGPRDMIDLQSFMWVQGSSEYD